MNLDDLIADRFKNTVDAIAAAGLELGKHARSFKEDVKECNIKELLSDVHKNNTMAYKWIASHMDKIEQRLTAMESNNEKKFKIRVELDDDENSDLCMRPRMTCMEIYSFVPDPDLRKLLIDFYGKNGEGTEISQRELAFKNGCSTSTAFNRLKKALRHIRSNGKSLAVNELPSCKFKSDLLGKYE